MTNQSFSETPFDQPGRPLERVLSAYTNLDSTELGAVRQVLEGPETFHPLGASLDADLQRTEARMVTRGWIARGAVLADGRRQIVSLYLPGDLLTATGAAGGDVTDWALTDAATLDAGRLWRTVRAASGPAVLSVLLQRLREAERARFVHQIIRLGRLTAYERTAHLFLELHDRQLRAGLSEAGVVQLPITQDGLADSLGLSAVHMNRTLQQLRRDQLIVYRGGQLLLPDLRGLRHAARLGLEAST